MKIRIEVDEKIDSDEIVIICSKRTSEIEDLKDFISDYIFKKPQLIFYKNNIEYYMDLAKVLFFETDDNSINSHTVDDMYQVKYKLYELEEILPKEFIRVSKSTILNVKHISSITRNIRSSSIVEFENTYKTTYVSRYYYKGLKNKIDEVKK